MGWTSYIPGIPTPSLPKIGIPGIGGWGGGNGGQDDATRTAQQDPWAQWKATDQAGDSNGLAVTGQGTGPSGSVVSAPAAGTPQNPTRDLIPGQRTVAEATDPRRAAYDADQAQAAFLRAYGDARARLPQGYEQVLIPGQADLTDARNAAWGAQQGLYGQARYGLPGRASSAMDAGTYATQGRAMTAAEAAAAGAVPSAAEAQMQRGLDQAMAQQVALASRARGGARSLALRTALGNQATMASQANLASAELRAAEQARAREQFMAALNAQRDAELGYMTGAYRAGTEAWRGAGDLGLNNLKTEAEMDAARQKLISEIGRSNQAGNLEWQRLLYGDAANQQDKYLAAILGRGNIGLGVGNADLGNRKQDWDQVTGTIGAITGGLGAVAGKGATSGGKG